MTAKIIPFQPKLAPAVRAVEYYSDPSVPLAERAKSLADEIDELLARIRRNHPEIFPSGGMK